jgi:hypothetical protein
MATNIILKQSRFLTNNILSRLQNIPPSCCSLGFFPLWGQELLGLHLTQNNTHTLSGGRKRQETCDIENSCVLSFGWRVVFQTFVVVKSLCLSLGGQTQDIGHRRICRCKYYLEDGIRIQ